MNDEEGGDDHEVEIMDESASCNMMLVRQSKRGRMFLGMMKTLPRLLMHILILMDEVHLDPHEQESRQLVN